MSERSEIEHVIRQYFGAINDNNASVIPLADDVVMSGPMMPETMRGEAAVRQYLDETAPFTTRFEVISLLVEGDHAAAIVEFEGLNGVVIQGAEFFHIPDGKVRSIQNFFDTRPLFKGMN